jgi:SAM-dependent methyltransferase
MKPSEVAASYDRLAPHWNGEEFNRENGIAQHERAFQFAPKAGYALDAGCGSSGRLITLLEGHGFTAEGLDLSENMLALAKRRHPHVAFYHADICEWQPPRSYVFISAWDSNWHVPLARQEGVIHKLCQALEPGGILIFTTGGVDTPDERHNPCMGEPMYHAALGISTVLRIMDGAGCICRHLEYDQYPSPHVYLIVQRAEPFPQAE